MPALPPGPPPRIRLVRASPRSTRPPAVPFGLASFDPEASEAIAVVLDVPGDWPASGYGDVARVAAQIPDAASLAPGALVLVLADADGGPPSLLGRFLKLRRARVARAIRGSALLALGFTRIGAGVDPQTALDLVWAYAPV